MITVDEFASVVSRTVKLSKSGIGRWRGLCPFHTERTPSFHIYGGRRGEGRFHCFGCGVDGDAIDWQRRVLGQAGVSIDKPDPALALELERRNAADREWRWLRDRDPELPEEARAFIETDLRESLRRHLTAN